MEPEQTAAESGVSLEEFLDGSGEELAARPDEREPVTEEGRRRSLLGRRIGRVLLLLTPFALVAAWYYRPTLVEVQQRPVWVWRTTTVWQAVLDSKVELPYGNLVDIRGGVLKAGAGAAPVPLSGNRPLSPQAEARHFRRIALQRGTDKEEPVREQAQLFASIHGPEWEAGWRNAYLAGGAAIVGLTRTEYGTLSGLSFVADEVRARAIRGAETARAGWPKRMALTFDDGPNGASTRRVLSILSSHHARATFFLLADCIGHDQALVRAEVAGGNEVGNHTWGHPLLTRMSVEAVLANVERAEGIISAASGKRCRWFRPPYGETTSAQRKALLAAGYNLALWSVDTEDWKKPGAEVIYQRIMAGAMPGAIVLCHDGGGDRSQTLEAISRAVPALIARGYELVPLSELAESVPSDDTGIVLLSGKEQWTAHAPKEPVRVLVQGRELPALAPVLVESGRALLPVGKVLEALGVKWQWDQAAQTITIPSGKGEVRLRLDSTRVLWDGRELRLSVPPVLYHGVPLVSAEVLAHAAGVQLEVGQSPPTYRFAPPAPAPLSPKAGPQ